MESGRVPRRASGLVLWPEEHGGGDGSGREVITLVNHSKCGIGTLLRRAALQLCQSVVPLG